MTELIRAANEKDVEAIANLHAESWCSTYRGILADNYLDGQIYRERLAIWQQRFLQQPDESMCVLVAEQDNRLAGFACVFRDEDPVYGS